MSVYGKSHTVYHPNSDLFCHYRLQSDRSKLKSQLVSSPSILYAIRPINFRCHYGSFQCVKHISS